MSALIGIAEVGHPPLTSRQSLRLAFLLGFIGKADRIAGPVQSEIVGSGYWVVDRRLGGARVAGRSSARLVHRAP